MGEAAGCWALDVGDRGGRRTKRRSADPTSTFNFCICLVARRSRSLDIGTMELEEFVTSDGQIHRLTVPLSQRGLRPQVTSVKYQGGGSHLARLPLDTRPFCVSRTEMTSSDSIDLAVLLLASMSAPRHVHSRCTRARVLAPVASDPLAADSWRPESGRSRPDRICLFPLPRACRRLFAPCCTKSHLPQLRW